MKTRRYLITGASSGFGLAIARAAIEAGHSVVGTVRDDRAAERLAALSGTGMAQACQLDVTDDEAVDRVVRDVLDRIGPIDVLVNNAGYGHEGIFEETSMAEVRRQFDVNVFGAVAMMKALVPHFRERRAGHVVNITSMGGTVTMPGITAYCGSKFALEGISEALGKELAPFGVHVTAVAPGSFRTDWAGRSMVRSPRSIADYDALMDPVRAARMARSGSQLGDPDKAARVIAALSDEASPPARLLLGSDALKLVRQQFESLTSAIDRWESTTVSTDG